MRIFSGFVPVRCTRIRGLVLLFTLAGIVRVVLYFRQAERRQESGRENPVSYHPKLPYVYPEEVDLRLIVLTFRRASSLSKLLASLDRLETDGDEVRLEIWIDRQDVAGGVDPDTLRIARTFSWSRGATRVHVHDRHVGICAQWIDTWRPKSGGGRELALILEDDLSVSPYAYRWLRAAHRKYGSRTDVAGYTIQSEQVNRADGGGPLRRPRRQAAFLYKLLGSWGFAPHPDSWLAFQDWYHLARRDANFRPYVDKAPLITKWYKAFELKNRHETMWTIWHVYYCDEHDLFTVYNNIATIAGSDAVLLAANRMEAGLHFQNKGAENTKNLLEVWSDEYIDLPDDPVRYDFNGALVPNRGL